MNSRERTAYQERRAAESAVARGGRKSSIAPVHRGVFAPVSERIEAAPKTAPYRDQVLLELARGRPCLLMVPAVCSHRVDTTVACHQNEGKGMGTKQSDAMSCWGCAACHVYYDRSGADRQRKRELFMQAHARQVLAWRLVATDPTEPERFRKAARRALESLNATPLGEAP